MKFVADEGVDAPIVHYLRERGHLVWYVAEMAAGVSDDTVLSLAREQDALLITNDKDFGSLVFQQRQVTSGVILLRLAGLTVVQKSQLVGQVVADYDAQLVKAFTVVTPSRVRVRPAR